MKFFSIAGPVNPEDHYCLPLSNRLDENELRMLISKKNTSFCMLHGKRVKHRPCLILLDNLMRKVRITALYVNVEGAQAARAITLRERQQFWNNF